MIELLHTDCMAYMSTLPDKAFDLAIVDPPYGIGMGKVTKYRAADRDRYKAKDWDAAIPSKEYFDELRRVSKDQIIWGGNYFANTRPNARCWIYWDKGVIVDNYGSGELAYTSFDRPMIEYRLTSVRWYHPDIQDGETRIHPTQKPKKLYKMLLRDFAKPGDRILDTHLGSGSSAIAAYDGGFDFVGCEIDADYYAAAVKRFNIHKQQLVLL